MIVITAEKLSKKSFMILLLCLIISKINFHLSVQVEQQKQALVLRERNERAAQDSGALSELQEVLDRERGRADDLQV